MTTPVVGAVLSRCLRHWTAAQEAGLLPAYAGPAASLAARSAFRHRAQEMWAAVP